MPALDDEQEPRISLVRTALFFLGLGVLWEVAVPLTRVPSYLLPVPSEILTAYQEKGLYILSNLVPTLYETVGGFLVGAAFGITAGIGIVYSRVLWETLYPALVLLTSVPRIAIAPLILIWFGLGPQSKIIIAFLVSFFPMVINSVVGLSTLAPELLELTRTMGASRWDEFRKIRCPNSLPFLFAGFKASIALAVVGAVVGEFIGGEAGLGYLIILGNNQLDTRLVFAALLVLTAMTLALFGIIVGLERILVPWQRKR